MTVEEMQKSSKNVTSIDMAIQTDPILSNQNSINGTTNKEDSENKNAINDIKKSELTQTVEKSEKEVKPEEKKRDESEKQEKNDEKKSESKEEKKSEKDIKEESKDEEQPIKKEKKRNLFSSINNKFKEKKKKGDEKTLKKTHSNTEVASKDKEETRKVEKERSKKSNPKEDVASKDKKETKKEEKEQSEKSDPKEDVASKDKKETKKEEKEQSKKSNPKEEVASKDKEKTKKEEKEQSEKSDPKEEVASKDKKETKKEEKEQSKKSDSKEEVASKDKEKTKKEEKEQSKKSDPKEEVATENKEETKNEEEEKSKKTDAKEEVASKDKEEKVKNDKAILTNGKKEGTENVATAETRQKKPHALRATLTRAFSFSPSSNKNRNTINAIPINTKVEATLYSIVICNSERIGPELVSSLIISGVRLYLIYTSNSVESAVSDKIKQLSSKISDPESRVSQLTPYLNNMSDLGQIITKLRHFPGSVENLYVAMNFSQNSRNIYNADNFNQNFFLNHLAFKSSKESELLRLPEFSELATLPDTPSNDTKKIKTNAGPLVYMALLYSDIVRKHRENRYRTQSTTSVSDGTNALKEEQLIINSDCTVHELTGAKPAVWFMNANVVKPLSKALIEEKSREENKIYKGFWFNNTPKECETVDLDGKVGLPEKHRELYNKITRLALAKKIDLLKSLLEENEVKDSSVGTREAKTGIDKEEMGNKNSTTNHSKKEDKKVSESKNEKDEKISENKIDEKAPNEPTKDAKEGKDGVKQSDKDVTKKEHHVEISDKIEIAGAVPPTNVDENSKEKESQSNQNEDKSLQEKESKPLESKESKEVQVTTDKTEENAKEETLNSAEKNDENQPEKETEKKDVSEPKNEAEESDPKDNIDIDPPKEVTVTEKNVEEKEHHNEDKDKNEAKETKESEKEASNDKKPEETEVKEEKTEEKAATTSKDDQAPEVNTETEKDKDTKNDQELNKSAELQSEGEKQEEKQNSDQNTSNVDKDVQEGN